MFLNLEREDVASFIQRMSSSKFNYWFGYVANLSLCVWLARQGWVAGIGAKEWIICAATGLFVWTFAEYILHRYAYHEVPSPLKVGHDHHDMPKALMGVPWAATTIALIGLYYGLAWGLNPGRVGVVMAFTWLGYIGYCFVHHSIHHFDFTNPWFRALRKHHLIHHVRHDRNHGITSTIWDHVFRTYRKSGSGE